MTQPISTDERAADVVDNLAARQRKIAAIHALAQWYTDHPDEPLPQYVSAHSRTTKHDGPEVDRVIDVTTFANRTGASLSEDWYEVRAYLRLLNQDGMQITVSHAATLEQRSAARYVH